MPRKGLNHGLMGFLARDFDTSAVVVSASGNGKEENNCKDEGKRTNTFYLSRRHATRIRELDVRAPFL